MSAIVATADEAVKEAPMHIDVQDLTFGYAGREVSNTPFHHRHQLNHTLLI